LKLNNWFWHGYDSTKIVLWAMEEANSLDPRDVIAAIPSTVEKYKDKLMIKPEGSVVTDEKGVFIKVPLWLAQFNKNADFATQSCLDPVKDEKYLGTPSWMPENWDGYKANPKDGSVNWYPTLNEINKMREEAGE